MKLKTHLMAAALLASGFAASAQASEMMYVAAEGNIEGFNTTGSPAAPVTQSTPAITLTANPPTNATFYSVGLGLNGNLWATSVQVDSSAAYQAELINPANSQVMANAGAPLTGLNTEGVVVNNNVLYLSDYNQGTISTFDPSSGAPVGTFASGLNGPEGLVFDSAGNLYVPIYGTGAIDKFSGNTPTVIATASGGVNGITIGPNGNLYVSTYSSDEVLQFTTNGTQIGGDFLNGGTLSHLGDIKFGPNGNLFVASAGTGDILEYDGTTGQYLGVFASGLDSPHSFVFAPTPVPELPVQLMLALGMFVPMIARHTRRCSQT